MRAVGRRGGQTSKGPGGPGVAPGCGRVGIAPPRARLRAAHGQAAIEIVGLLPILVAVALGAAQLLAAGIARELADHAAEAGAVAVLQGGDPETAARDALPGWARDRLTVTVDGRRISVVVRPPAPWPALAGRLSAHAGADAGEGS
jgi:hypothetical protein